MALQARIESKDDDLCVGGALIFSGQASESLLSWFHPDKQFTQQQTSPVPHVDVIYSALRRQQKNPGKPSKLMPFLFRLSTHTHTHLLNLCNDAVDAELQKKIVVAHGTPRVRFVLEDIIQKACADYSLANQQKQKSYRQFFWDACQNSLKEPEKTIVLPNIPELIESTPVIHKKALRKLMSQKASTGHDAIAHDSNLQKEDEVYQLEKIKKNQSQVAKIYGSGACQANAHPLDHDHVLRDLFSNIDYLLKHFDFLEGLTGTGLEKYNDGSVFSFRHTSFQFLVDEINIDEEGANLSRLISANPSHSHRRFLVRPEQLMAAQERLIVVSLLNICLLYAQLQDVRDEEIQTFQVAFLSLCQSDPLLASITRDFCSVLVGLKAFSGDVLPAVPVVTDAQSSCQKVDFPKDLQAFCSEVLCLDDLFVPNKHVHMDLDVLYRMVLTMQASSDAACDANAQATESAFADEKYDSLLVRLNQLALFADTKCCLQDFVDSVSQKDDHEQNSKIIDRAGLAFRIRKHAGSLLLYDAGISPHDVVKMIYAVVNQEIRITHEYFWKHKRLTHSELSNAQPVTAAGELIFRKVDGCWSLYIVNNGSGHYRPYPTSTLLVVDVVKQLLANQNIDVSDVHVCSCLKPLAPIYTDTSAENVPELLLNGPVEPLATDAALQQDDASEVRRPAAGDGSRTYAQALIGGQSMFHTDRQSSADVKRVRN